MNDSYVTVPLIPLLEGIKMFAVLKFGDECSVPTNVMKLNQVCWYGCITEQKTKHTILSIPTHKNKMLRFQLKFTKFIDSFGREFAYL